MKLIMNLNEAKDIIRRHLSLAADTTIEFTSLPDDRLVSLVNKIDNLRIGGNNIAAVKEYRTFTGTDLWEAKTIAMDNWPTARDIIMREGRLPRASRVNSIGDAVIK